MKDGDKWVRKVLVELDMYKSLQAIIEIEWCGRDYSKKLDYWGILFHYSLCQQVGHVYCDCVGKREGDILFMATYLQYEEGELVEEANKVN